MHEAHIVNRLFNAAVESARQNGAARVTAVNLRLGPESAVKPEAFRFYWDTLSPGTICAGAQLNFAQAVITASCLDCGHAFTPEAGAELCPACGSARLHLIGSGDIRLESLEIDSA